jgi:mannose-6-phosphate isomerase-like protein (cupin superfamily)
MEDMQPSEFQYEASLPKEEVALRFEADLVKLGYKVTELDFNRPWGGFFRIADNQAEKFLAEYFSGVSLPPTVEGATLSPKFLIVEPNKKLSWQVHDRRAEFWRVVNGPVGTYLSGTDEQPEKPQVFQNGETIDMPVGTRHRLAGLDNRGIVAEIWIHTDPNNPSDELDIRRISDDFGRQS